MSKKQVAVEEQAPAQEQEQAQPVTNHTLVYRRDHPQNRCSYGIAGVPGIVVFDKGLFANGVAPETITLDCVLTEVKEDKKVARATAQAAKLQERATKAQQRIELATAKAKERQEKAEAALAAAKARLAAATTVTAKA